MRTPSIPPGPFLVSRTGGAGLTANEVRSGKLVTPSRGVRIPADVDDMPRALVEAAVLTAPTGSVLCDVEAARWWGLPLPPWFSDEQHARPVVVASPAGNRRSRRNGTSGRRLDLPDDHVTMHNDQPVTSVARTYIDCAEMLRIEDVITLGDAALHRNLVSMAELDAMVRWSRRRRGIRKARLAMPLLDAGSESPGESYVRACLVLDGIPSPQCNVNITHNGMWLARVDLPWLAERVIVEYDGIVHLDNAQRLRDAARRNALQGAGWLVITFTSADLGKPLDMILMVRRALVSGRSLAR